MIYIAIVILYIVGYKYQYLKLSYMYNIIYRCMWNCRGCVNRIFNMYTLEKGAINVVEIETLIFVKYNVDKHIKNSARLYVSFAKSIILRGKESPKWQKNIMYTFFIYTGHTSFALNEKYVCPKHINFRQLLYVLTIVYDIR